jgi:hypothetical protein
LGAVTWAQIKAIARQHRDGDSHRGEVRQMDHT